MLLLLNFQCEQLIRGTLLLMLFSGRPSSADLTSEAGRSHCAPVVVLAQTKWWASGVRIALPCASWKWYPRAVAYCVASRWHREKIMSSTFSLLPVWWRMNFKKDKNERTRRGMGVCVDENAEMKKTRQQKGRVFFTQGICVYISGWIHKVGWAWERSSHTLGSRDRPQGSQKAQKSTEGG